jgi:hypothetical protein
MIVTVNGDRVRTAAGIEHMADGSSAYLLPDRLGFSQSVISDTEVLVYIDDIPQILGVDFFVEPFDGTPRAVEFAVNPTIGQKILIAVTTRTQCYISGNQLVFDPTQGQVPVIGDIIVVTTWNDTRQQDILTKVFVGPITTGITISEGFDDTNFDPEFIANEINGPTATFTGDGSTTEFVSNITVWDLVDPETQDDDATEIEVYINGALQSTSSYTFTTGRPVTIDFNSAPASGADIVLIVKINLRSSSTDAFNNDPGSFDYAEGATVTVNDLQLGRVITDPNRLWVTLNGNRLFFGNGFTINGEELILASGTLNPLDIVMITMITDSVVPDAMAFRIFQDMRGVQATYRITPSTTTALTQSLGQYDDVMYVDNASALDTPDLVNNIWGILTVNGERIMYRDVDYTLNTVSGLRRGTAGTGSANHAAGSIVYDLGRGNLMPEEFQNYVDSNDFVGNDIDTSFVTDIVINNRPVVSVGGSVEVRLNGTLQDADTYNVTALEPVTVIFKDNIPTAGTIVRITVIDTLSVSTSQTFTASGSSARFSTTLDIGLVEQSTSSYVVDNFEPIAVTFNNPVPAGQVVYITTQDNTTEFDYSFSDGIELTFGSDLELALPVRVYVGGIEQTNSVDYVVTSLTPISVEFVEPVPAGQEVTILVRRGVTWYAPGTNTPSNGVALQDTDTQAARFLRGQ